MPGFFSPFPKPLMPRPDRPDEPPSLGRNDEEEEVSNSDLVTGLMVSKKPPNSEKAIMPPVQNQYKNITGGIIAHRLRTDLYCYVRIINYFLNTVVNMCTQPFHII